jgi:hypothetical protein
LIQWALIGVMASFFVFLAFHFLEATDTPENPASRYFGRVDPQALEICPDPQDRGGWQNIFNTCQQDPQADICICLSLAAQFRGGGQTGPLVELIGNLLPVAVTLVLLGLALTLGFRTGAMGATAIIHWGRTRGRVWGARAWQRGKRAVAERARLRERVPEHWRERFARWSAGETPGTRRGAVIRGVARATGFAWVTRAIGERGLGVIEAEMSEVKKYEEAMKDKLIERKLAELEKAKTRAQRIGVYRSILEAGQIGDLREKLEARGLDENQIKRYMINLAQEAIRIHPEIAESIIKTMPHLAEDIAKDLTEEARRRAGLEFTDEDREKGYINIIEKITAELAPKDIEKLDIVAFDDKSVKDAIHRFWSGRELSAAGREFGRAFVDTFMERAEELGADWYAMYNPKIIRFLRTTAAQELGFGMPPGATLEEEEIPPEPGKPPRERKIVTPEGKTYEPRGKYGKTTEGIYAPEEEEAPRRFREGVGWTKPGVREVKEIRIRKYYEKLLRDKQAELERLQQKPTEKMSAKELERVEQLLKEIKETEQKIEEEKKKPRKAR